MASKSKKHANSGLGRNLIKENRRSSKRGEESWRHTSELDDGYDWGRLNLKSVTEESNLDDFLRTAQLAGTEFLAEKMNVKVVPPNAGGLPSQEEREEIRKAQEANKQFLGIPRKPQWTQQTTREQLGLMERESFLAWRRNLAKLQENEQLVLTPYERNLEFWQQLWRVVEMSHVVVQIVDARNPLLFRCEDLEKYVKEQNPSKINILLLNKADHLTEDQRMYWSEYFTSASLPHAFWSATEEKTAQEQIRDLPVESTDLIRDHKSGDDEELDEGGEGEGGDGDEEKVTRSAHMDAYLVEGQNMFGILDQEDSSSSSEEDNDDEQQTNMATTQDHLESLSISSKVGEKDSGLTKSEQGSLTEQVTLPPPHSVDDLQQSSDISPQLTDVSQQLSAGAMQEAFEVTQQSEDITQQSTQVVQQDPVNSPTSTLEGDKSFIVGFEQRVNGNNSSVNRATEAVIDVAESLSGGSKELPESTEPLSPADAPGRNKAKVLTREELLEFFRQLCPKPTNGRLHVGLVGYPNVGKSSTINVLYQQKKTPVSATPGRTKHVQTLLVEDDICLCDCPGLVFPTFVNTKAEMVCNGILPIDQLRDPIPPVAMVCQQIPRSILQRIYGIYLPPPTDEMADPNGPPSPRELLAAYARERGFMGNKGNPDLHRASRHILKDYTNGKLLYCYPPPGVSPQDFNPHLTCLALVDGKEAAMKIDPILTSTLNVNSRMAKEDRKAQSQDNVMIVSKGVHGLKGFTRKDGFVHHQGNTEEDNPVEEFNDAQSVASGSSLLTNGQKPWKKHYNKHKKEKIRRLH